MQYVHVYDCIEIYIILLPFLLLKTLFGLLYQQSSHYYVMYKEILRLDFNLLVPGSLQNTHLSIKIIGSDCEDL